VDRGAQQRDVDAGDVRERDAMSRLRADDGFTLMEAVMAITIGFVVLAATFTLLDSSVRLNTGVMAKTDAMQRGRQAMDTITQQLRSQVCLDYAHSAVLSGSDANSVTFYMDYSQGDLPPVKRKLTFDPAKREIRSARYQSSSSLPQPPDTSYPASATSTQTILENATLQLDDQKKPVPFLQYFAYPDPQTVAAGAELQPNVALTPPLSTAQAARVARIEVNFLADPTGARDDSRGVNLTDQVMARHADPNLSIPDPNCI
jgi:hypothetical protein